VVRHPDGIILVDTGIGTGNQLIDEWYRPEVISLSDALAPVGLEPADIEAVVLSHLHFDHCGQQRMLHAPVFVQATEHEEAQRPRYTVAAWATIPADRRRLVRGDEEIVQGIRLIATPGHTPGHQSVVVQTHDGPVVLAAQCAFRASELLSGEPGPTNIHDESWRDVARHSLSRIRELAPATAHLSHDPQVVRLS
jgi:N-acyl homoserine lactone hydrolase